MLWASEYCNSNFPLLSDQSTPRLCDHTIWRHHLLCYCRQKPITVGAAALFQNLKWQTYLFSEVLPGHQISRGNSREKLEQTVARFRRKRSHWSLHVDFSQAQRQSVDPKKVKPQLIVCYWAKLQSFKTYQLFPRQRTAWEVYTSSFPLRPEGLVFWGRGVKYLTIGSVEKTISLGASARQSCNAAGNWFGDSPWSRWFETEMRWSMISFGM